MTPTIPRASRPHMPGYGILKADEGLGLLPWSWATERLAQALTYWIATTRPDGRPHAMPVWGLWLEDKFYFSSGKDSRKARNLAANPYCVVGIDLAHETVSLEGIAALEHDEAVLLRFTKLCSAKYDWDMSDFAEPVYTVHPRVAFGFSAADDEFHESATRWMFDPPAAP